MPIDRDTKERHARIAQMIEAYRAAKQRRVLQRAIRLWRRAEAHQQVEALEAEPERIH